MAVAVGAGIKRGLFDDDPVFGSPSPSKRVRGVSVASVVGASGPSPLRAAGAPFNPFSATPDHNLVQLAQLCALFPDMDPQVRRAPLFIIPPPLFWGWLASAVRGSKPVFTYTVRTVERVPCAVPRMGAPPRANGPSHGKTVWIPRGAPWRRVYGCTKAPAQCDGDSIGFNHSAHCPQRTPSQREMGD